MDRRSRKLTSGVVIVLGGAVIAATVAASWDLVMEQVYLWRLGSEDPEPREAAAEKLVELGSVKVAPYLIERFGETIKDHGVDGAAFNDTPLMGLVNSRGADPQRSQWGELDPDFYRLQSLLLEIARRGPSTAEYFVPGLGDEHAPTRALCAFLLGETGDTKDSTLSALGNLLSDTDPFVRSVAVVSLGRAGDPRAAPLLVEALADHGNRMRVAVWALEEIGAAAVPHLIDTLRNGRSAAPIYAAFVLGRIGPEARVAVPHLAAILEDETADRTLRLRAAVALRKLGGAKAVSSLARVMKRAAGEMRALAASNLSQVGSPAVSELVKALTHEKAGVRAAAVFALGEIGDVSEAVVRAVTKTLGDPDESVRQQAVDSLESLSRSDDENVRRAAEEALGSAGEDAQRRSRPSGRRFR